MTVRRYHDFVILTDDPKIGPDGKLGEFTVRVFQSPAGEGERKEPVPIRDYSVLDKQRRKLAKRRLGLQEQIALGRRLAELLLPPRYALPLFQRSMSELNHGEGLRLRLRLLRELAHLPWEYIYLQEEGEEPATSNFLVLDPRISIVRHEAIAIPPERIPPGDTRRILLTMATPKPHEKYKPLDHLPIEQLKITEALSEVKGTDVHCLPDYGGVVEWETIPGARLDQVQAKIQKFEHVDVFHFSGHGDFATEMAPLFGEHEGVGHIILADEDNRAVPVAGDRLAEMLREHGIRLVTLGACETGKRDIFHDWSSVAAALLKGRIPSVVAMQFRVRDDFAAAFMAAVYQALVDGRTIDEAVFHGRAAIRALSYGACADARDWGTPVLYSRVPGGCLFPPVEDEEARQQAQQSLDARSSLHQAWWDWTDHRATASRSQLQYLASVSESLELQPAQALLLLRSAVGEDEPVEPWLAHLRRTGADLMTELDDPGAVDATASREEASVFDLDGAPQQDRAQDVGPVAWAAASHDAEMTRHTAALALTALPPVPEAGLQRLDRALDSLKPSRKRFARMAELRGALADGDPQIERWNAGLPPWDRLGIWSWRFWRRVLHDWERILLLTLGGGLGAGVGLGLLRAFVVMFTLGKKGPANYLLMYGYLGFMIGAALCLGMLLAEPALLRPLRRRGIKSAEPPGRSQQVLAATLGAIFFGLTLAALAGLRGVSIVDRPLVYLFGFVLGLGLSLALYGQPRAGRRLGAGSALLRLGVVAGISAAIQAVFLWVPDTGAALDVALSVNFYEAFFRDTAVSAWLDWISLLDAALAGAVLAVGLTEGLGLANRLVLWLQDLRRRAGA
jgi:hypothetical protein